MKSTIGIGSVLAILLPVAGGLGCAARPFVRADAPVSSGGLTVALVGQKCGREAYYEDYDVLELEMVVRVTNAGDTPVAVDPSQIRLLARGSSPVPRASKPKGGDAALEIAPHASADVKVDFQRWGNAKCDQPMQLSMGRALAVSGKAVTLLPLSFVATRDDA